MSIKTNSKNLILTITLGEKYKQVAVITHNSIKQYANKINADFLVIDQNYLHDNTNSPHWNKFLIKSIFEQQNYDRILYIDTDVIIRNDCPNLFNIVPEDKIGMFNEGKYESRFNPLQEALKIYNIQITDWDGSYYNSGVIVISKQHKDLFVLPETIHSLPMFEQSYLNILLLKSEFSMYDLDYKFNRMSLMDKLIGESRYASYIIHYAGANQHYEMLYLMENDLLEWNRKSPNYEYPKNAIIIANGELADIICSEPVVRYMVTELYDSKKDTITLVTEWTTVFEHLKPYITNIVQELPPRQPDTIVYETNSLNLWKTIRESSIHPVDFASISAINQLLPIEYRQIKLNVNPNHNNFLAQFIQRDHIYNRLILINPTDDDSDFYLSLIHQLKDRHICIIGKSKFSIQEHVIDLRYELNFEQVTLLISKADILISEQSHFVYIAGAFPSVHIIITNANKHYDFVTPYRHINTYPMYIPPQIDKTPKQIYRQPSPETGRRFPLDRIFEQVVEIESKGV
jgi:lipopolysaccharide biosynthesis glycosyltransferase